MRCHGHDFSAHRILILKPIVVFKCQKMIRQTTIVFKYTFLQSSMFYEYKMERKYCNLAEHHTVSVRSHENNLAEHHTVSIRCHENNFAEHHTVHLKDVMKIILQNIIFIRYHANICADHHFYKVPSMKIMFQNNIF